jgi:hypothetical protein
VIPAVWAEVCKSIFPTIVEGHWGVRGVEGRQSLWLAGDILVYLKDTGGWST